MKEGWEYKKLGDICRKGKNIKWDDQTNDTSFRYIDLTSVDRNDLCIHNPQIITKDNAPSRAKQIIQAGDIIFATTRPTLRRVSLIDEQYDGDICSTGFCVLRPNKEVKSKIIFYALLNDSFYKYIEPLQTGANYPAVTDSIVKNYIILVPPLSEQQSIVDYLDSAFAKIDAMKANAEKALNEAKALFQASLKEMLEPKEGWDSIKLGDFAYMKAGDFVKASDIYQNYAEGLYPCYGGNGFRGYVNEPNQEGDFCLIGRQGALCGCVNRAKGIFRTTEHAVIVKPYQDIPTSLVYYMLINLNLNKYATGAAQPGLSVNNIAEVVIISVPPHEDQQHIADTLDSLKSKVDRLQANYDKISQECDALKQAILRKVFE